MIKSVLRLLFVAIVTIIIAKASTFGWRIFGPSAVDSKPKDNSIPDNLKRHVLKISSEIGNRDIFDYENLKRTADYISGQFRSYGYDVKFQEYIIENKKVSNIIVVKKGISLPDEVVVVGAHYDSCFNPGADDNASGIAGLLELARFFSDKNTGRTVKFVAFVNEEPPYFKTENMGSRRFAREAKANKEDIKAAIILETIGYYTNKINSQRYPLVLGIFYPNRGNFISVIGNFNSRSLVDKINKSFRGNSKFPIEALIFGFVPGADFSDHWSFWQEGYPAVMVTDTAFLRNFNYHKNTDTWERLNYNYMACVIEGFYFVLGELTK